jgi:hypothetical protein
MAISRSICTSRTLAIGRKTRALILAAAAAAVAGIGLLMLLYPAYLN